MATSCTSNATWILHPFGKRWHQTTRLVFIYIYIACVPWTVETAVFSGINPIPCHSFSSSDKVTCRFDETVEVVELGRWVGLSPKQTTCFIHDSNNLSWWWWWVGCIAVVCRAGAGAVAVDSSKSPSEEVKRFRQAAAPKPWLLARHNFNKAWLYTFVSLRLTLKFINFWL